MHEMYRYFYLKVFEDHTLSRMGWFDQNTTALQKTIY